MTHSQTGGAHPQAEVSAKPSSTLHYIENVAISLALACMVLIPLAEIVLRRTLRTGISGSSDLVRHLVLVVGMLGAGIAAREDRLLSLSAFSAFLTGRWKAAARIITGAVTATVTVFLCIASVKYVWISRGAAKTLAYEIPVWVIQLVIPVGFGLITVRVLRHATPSITMRTLTLLTAAALVAIGLLPPMAPSALDVPALVLLLLAAILGSPIYTVLGGAALILFWAQESPISSLALDHYQMVVNPSLPAIPMFTLAGYFLAEGGASRRIIRVFDSLMGQVRGGAAIVTILVCGFFTTFTGASGVTILALGALLMPVLMAAHYSERNALGLLTAAGSLGLLFPPCLPPILYSIVSTSAGASVSLKEIFLGGLIPGTLLVVLMAWWGVRKQPASSLPGRRLSLGEAAAAIWDAKWELLLPVVALGALFSGFATPVEASAVTALYAFIVETFVYRDLQLTRHVPRLMTECGLLVGGILLILGVAMGFTNYLVDAQIPDKAAEWVQSSIHSPLVFLLALNLFLLVVGCLMDIFSAIIVVVPLIAPVGMAFGVDPVHLGIIFLANLELGYLTPPVGMNLFLSAYRFSKPLPEVVRAVLPFLAVLLLGVLLITYIPPLTTFLPRHSQ